MGIINTRSTKSIPSSWSRLASLRHKNSVEKLGIEHLKDYQREAITAFMEGKDVFVSLLMLYASAPLIYHD